MAKILDYGGMVQFDIVDIYGKEIALLKPLEKNETTFVRFHYNYFEDEQWETAGFKADTSHFFSDNIGFGEFRSVVMAAYSLYEILGDDIGYAIIDGDVQANGNYLGWISHLMDKDVCYKNNFRLWDSFEAKAIGAMECQPSHELPDFDYVFEFVPRHCRKYIGGTELADILLITNGIEELESGKVKPNSYPSDILECKKMFDEYFANAEGSITEKAKKIRELVKKKIKNRRNAVGDIKPIADASLYLPARVLIYLLCHSTNKEFWPVWYRIRKKAYSDEVMRQYAPDEILKQREFARNTPVQRVKTSDFLRIDKLGTFMGTPEEFEDNPEYFISDDDRIYWWDGSDEVVISEDMDNWIKQLKVSYDKILEENSEPGKNDEFIREFINSLDNADYIFRRISAFENMFYEFLQNGSDRRYIAALRLFEKLCEDNKEKGNIRKKYDEWHATSRKVTFNQARLEIKRYLSIMANKPFREKYFGF